MPRAARSLAVGAEIITMQTSLQLSPNVKLAISGRLVPALLARMTSCVARRTRTKTSETSMTLFICQDSLTKVLYERYEYSARFDPLVLVP